MCANVPAESSAYTASGLYVCEGRCYAEAPSHYDGNREPRRVVAPGPTMRWMAGVAVNRSPSPTPGLENKRLQMAESLAIQDLCPSASKIGHRGLNRDRR